ncbi:hypothetical protein O3G_MSEX007593 [Manduca sexta]|uniref:Uncharacterized protein n=1 Tax=Manduca sexta TaxID=7130 RepID=A0A921Z6R8_MANSE|nr:hypothetical protein O3G_MSEX007593 [Manduca sexta]
MAALTFRSSAFLVQPNDGILERTSDRWKATRWGGARWSHAAGAVSRCAAQRVPGASREPRRDVSPLAARRPPPAARPHRPATRTSDPAASSAPAPAVASA